MSDFSAAETMREARKIHKCTWCTERINNGDVYVFQKGNYDGAWYETKMHPECWKDFCDSGENEYIQYSADRPTKINPATILEGLK